MNYTVTPAYGRKYKNKEQVLKDLGSGKDFIEHSPRGGYINLPQIRGMGVTTVAVKQAEKVWKFKVSDIGNGAERSTDDRPQGGDA